MPAEDEDLGYLSGDWRIFQKQRGHRWSLDDLMTAWLAVPLAEQLGARRHLDLGCGLGSVLMLLAWRFPSMESLGIEAQADRAELGRRSLRYNGAAGRCQIVDGDLRADTPAGPFDLVTGTPPYFPRGTGTESDKTHALACRFEVRGGVEDYLATAARVVSAEGWVVICSAALEEARVVQGAAHAGLHVRHHVAVIGKEGKQPLVLLDALHRSPGARSDRTMTIRQRDGQWTEEFRAVRDEFGMPNTPP